MQHRPAKKPKFQTTTLLAAVVLMLILFVTVGYFFIIPDTTSLQKQERLLADLQAHAEQWRTSRPVSYSYIVERQCFCPEAYSKPYIVTVVREHRTARIVTPPGATDSVSKDAPEPVWIDELFELAADAATGAGNVDVIFNPRFGYPSRVRIDDLMGAPASVAAYTVRDFEVIDYE